MENDKSRSASMELDIFILCNCIGAFIWIFHFIKALKRNYFSERFHFYAYKEVFGENSLSCWKKKVFSRVGHNPKNCKILMFLAWIRKLVEKITILSNFPTDKSVDIHLQKLFFQFFFKFLWILLIIRFLTLKSKLRFFLWKYKRQPCLFCRNMA